MLKDASTALQIKFMFQRYEQLPLKNTTRGVTICSMKHTAEPSDFVLYCSDGQCTSKFAQHFYQTIPQAAVWFVGVDSSPDDRNAEYVIGRDDERFRVHESFFVDTLLGWTEQAIGKKHDRDRAGVFGFSCGGAFAASMGIRHPDKFGTVFAFSVAGRPIQDFSEQPCSDVSSVTFHFRAGTREPGGMHKYMQRLETWLARAGAKTSNAKLPGGHEFPFWATALNATLLMVEVKGS